MLIMFRYAWLPFFKVKETRLLMNIKRRHGAYIMAGFAVQRERIESLAGFRNIAMLSAFHCLLSMGIYGD